MVGCCYDQFLTGLIFCGEFLFKDNSHSIDGINTNNYKNYGNKWEKSWDEF